MNKQNIKIWHESNHLHGEWSDRALDDDERYEDDSIILTAKVEASERNRLSEKKLFTKLCIIYDNWIKETRK